MSQAVPLDPPRRLLDVEIDGDVVRVPEGSTLLDACRSHGVDTPTLCYADNLTPVNACRVCVVEVEGSRVLVPACSRLAEDGMKVKTDTERVQHSRKLVMEFLASSVDVELTSPDVHRWMTEYQVHPERFGAEMEPASTGERDRALGGAPPRAAGPDGGRGRRAAGEDRQRALRPRLLPLHPLLQVRGGVRRRRAEHVRDRRGGPRVRRPDLHGVRRPVERVRVRVLRQLHRRLPHRRADVHVRA